MALGYLIITGYAYVKMKKELMNQTFWKLAVYISVTLDVSYMKQPDVASNGTI